MENICQLKKDEKVNHPTSRKEEKVKHLSGEEKWNRMITIISFLLYTTYVILAVLSLYFTSGPTPEDVALGGKFMLALAALVIAHFALRTGRRP